MRGSFQGGAINPTRKFACNSDEDEESAPEAAPGEEGPVSGARAVGERKEEDEPAVVGGGRDEAEGGEKVAVEGVRPGEAGGGAVSWTRKRCARSRSAMRSGTSLVD